MTKSNVFRYCAATFFLGSMLFCFCVKLDESTDLGSGVINTVDPGKTDIDNYFQGFLLDSASFRKSLSVPVAGDTGFGYHAINLSTGKMFIGKANNEHSAGYIEFIIRRDSLSSTRFFIDGDTLSSVKMLFSGVFPNARQFDLFAVSEKKNAPVPELLHKLGTISFSARGDTSQIDSVTIFDSLNAASFNDLFCDSIFRFYATADSNPLNRWDTLRFAVINAGDTLDSLTGNCSIIMSARRPSDTVLKVKAIGSSLAWYIAAEDGNADTLGAKPLSSFASKRTAVFEYRVDSLWEAMDEKSVLLTAGFLIPNTASDTIFVQCIARSAIEHDGVLLDSVFATESAVVTVAPGEARFASVAGALQKMFVDGSKPASVYLHVRYTNATSRWKTVLLESKPSLKAMITNPFK